MIEINSTGSFKKTDDFLARMKSDQVFAALKRYGEQGVVALADATPIDTSETAHAWYYEVGHKAHAYFLTFRNNHMAGGTPVIILLEYGHATGTGGYVQGRDFINPIIRPIFDQIATDVWKEVTR